MAFAGALFVGGALYGHSLAQKRQQQQQQQQPTVTVQHFHQPSATASGPSTLGCGGCRNTLQLAPGTMPGTQVTCPHCRAILSVPYPQGQLQQPAPQQMQPHMSRQATVNPQMQFQQQQQPGLLTSQPIVIGCGGCQNHVNVAPGTPAGSQVQCPRCHAILAVPPQPQQAPPEMSRQNTSQPIVIGCGGCRSHVNVAPGTPAGSMVRCPTCQAVLAVPQETQQSQPAQQEQPFPKETGDEIEPPPGYSEESKEQAEQAMSLSPQPALEPSAAFPTVEKPFAAEQQQQTPVEAASAPPLSASAPPLDDVERPPAISVHSSSLSTLSSQQMQGQPVQGQPVQDQTVQGQPMQGQPMQGQPMQGQPVQGQPMQGQPMQGQPMQGQPMQGQPMQGQPMQSMQHVQQSLSGYLHKTGKHGLRAAFQRRWCVLSDQTISYYKKETDTRPKGQVCITKGCPVAQSVQSSKPNTFYVEVSGRRWYFACESEQSMNEWMQQVRLRSQ